MAYDATNEAANDALTRHNLKTPKAAAIAGMLFSVLLLAVFVLLRIAIPTDPEEPGAWLSGSSNLVALAVNLVPFAGIAFLWFIGVLRDRLGRREDRFFATVFFGSGLLFLGMLFTAAAMVGGLLMAFAAEPGQLIDSATYYFARAAVYNIVNIYMTKWPGYLITTSTMAVYRFARAGWRFGYALAIWCCLAAIKSPELRRLSAVGLYQHRILVDNISRSAGIERSSELTPRLAVLTLTPRRP
jgi:MFS family permease